MRLRKPTIVPISPSRILGETSVGWADGRIYDLDGYGEGRLLQEPSYPNKGQTNPNGGDHELQGLLNRVQVPGPPLAACITQAFTQRICALLNKWIFYFGLVLHLKLRRTLGVDINLPFHHSWLVCIYARPWCDFPLFIACWFLITDGIKSPWNSRFNLVFL